MASTEDLLDAIFAEAVGYNMRELKHEDDLRLDLAMDGVDFIVMSAELRSCFGIDMETSEIEKCRTAGELITLMRGLVQNLESTAKAS